MKIIRTILAALCLLPALAFAQLTTPQMTTLKAVCAADTPCNDLMLAADDIGMAAWYNTADPAYIVWRTSVSRAEVMRDAGFDWARVDNLTTGKSRIWEWLFLDGPMNPSAANVRAGIDAAWVGTQADLNVRTAIYVLCKRAATRAEKALASGSGTSGSPSVMTYQGSITYQQASTIRSL